MAGDAAVAGQYRAATGWPPPPNGKVYFVWPQPWPVRAIRDIALGVPSLPLPSCRFPAPGRSALRVALDPAGICPLWRQQGVFGRFAPSGPAITLKGGKTAEMGL